MTGKHASESDIWQSRHYYSYYHLHRLENEYSLHATRMQVG